MAQGNPLTQEEVRKNFSERSPVLMAIITYLEGSEHWTVDRRGSAFEHDLMRLGDRISASAPPPVIDIDTDEDEQTRILLNYIQAGRMLSILEWLSDNDNNSELLIRAITMHEDQNSLSFSERLRVMFLIMGRAEMLHKIFCPERQMQIIYAIESANRK